MAKYEDEILAALHQNNLVMQQMVAQQTTPKSDVSGLKAIALETDGDVSFPV